METTRTMYSVRIGTGWLGRTSFQRLEIVPSPFRYLWETREDATQALLTFGTDLPSSIIEESK
jgi:hypothetical protein